VNDCIFCGPEPERVFLENELAYALWDSHPVTELHALVIPRRHAPDYFALTPAEVLACDELLRRTRDLVSGRDAAIDAFNIGINVGAAAGQTVFHCHIHLIPRRSGDVENPRGGVRWVIPRQGWYPEPA
jgi:diadenosine tetraphosphate (Ap4A) HIT family hydrolase